jgi:RNA-directed DNA polymerase
LTHSCGTNNSGYFTIERRTERKRLEAKLQQVKQALRERMHERVPEVGEWLGRVVNGYFQYHGVPGNLSSLYRFRDRVKRYWRRALERRSQTGRLDMNRLAHLFDRWLPSPRMCILIRSAVLLVFIRGRSRMR